MCFPGSRPTVSRPRSAVRGVRPIATRISSASTVAPSPSSTRTAPFRSTEDTVVSSRTSTPPSRRADSTSALANGSSRSISRGPRWTSVTREPSDDQACAISTPTTPPPRTNSLAGTRFAVVASMFVQGFASARPSTSGIVAELPVATTTALRATSAYEPTTTRRSPSSRPCPRTRATPRSSSQGSIEESSRSWTTSSRRARTVATSSSPTSIPGTRRASATSSPGRRSAFEGMQAKKEHSPPTSRSSTTATESPASPRRPATTSPGAPAPITTTSSSRSSTLRPPFATDQTTASPWCVGPAHQDGRPQPEYPSVRAATRRRRSGGSRGRRRWDRPPPSPRAGAGRRPPGRRSPGRSPPR